jgi:zinc transporter ZupT
MPYIRKKIERLGRAFVIFCALSFGIFLVSVYPPTVLYFYVGLLFVFASGLGTIVSLFLTFHPASSNTEQKPDTDLTIVK